jgi:hypothetical protein
MVAMVVTVGTFLLSPRGADPTPKKACFGAPSVGVLPVCVWICLSLTWFFLLLSLFLNSKGDFRVVGVVPHLIRLFINRLCARCQPCT